MGGWKKVVEITLIVNDTIQMLVNNLCVLKMAIANSV